MKHSILRKIALAVVLALLVGCFTGCKSEGNEEESAVVDEYVEGTEQEMSGDAPAKVDNENPPVSEDTETPDDDQQGSEEEPDDSQQGEEQPDEEQPDEEQTDGEQTDEEQNDDSQSNEDLFDEFEMGPFSMDKALKIVSYNIKCAMYGKTFNQLAEQLKAVDADIVGLQECDFNTNRSGAANQVQKLAELAGYKYWYFAPVIDLSSGDYTQHAPADLDTQAYGHGILSKYPITKSEIIWPEAQNADGECRNFERHEIDVNGKTVAFYNTHADFNKGREQYLEVQENYMAKDKYAICVGDFNETLDEMIVYFDEDNFYSFAFGLGNESPVLRGEEGKKSQVIDHIIVSKHTMSWYDEEVQNGYYVVPHEGASDHNMVYAYVNLLD